MKYFNQLRKEKTLEISKNIKRNCLECGKEFNKHSGWNKQRFCSKKCKIVYSPREGYIFNYRKTDGYRKSHLKHANNFKNKNPLIINIYNKTNYYIKIPEGKLCELCKKDLAEEKHHLDYSKPLEVQFLCIPCHKKIHRQESEEDLWT